MLQRSYAMIKPDGFEKAMQILEDLDLVGKSIATLEIGAAPRELIEKIYSEYKGRSHYEPMVEYMTGKSLIISIREEEDMIKKLRKAIGATEPAKADLGTIRRKYGGNESYELARSEGRMFIHNVVHSPDSEENYRKEIEVFGPYFRLTAA